jgi:peptidoglycan/LPS O-acetylase OafA/YrhL
VAAVFAGLLGVALFSREDQWLGRALRQRWLRYVGKISYGLYLFHISIYLAVGSFFSRQAPIMQTSRIGWFGIAITSIAAVFGLASLSWYFFESQLLRLKRFFQRGS